MVLNKIQEYQIAVQGLKEESDKLKKVCVCVCVCVYVCVNVCVYVCQNYL